MTTNGKRAIPGPKGIPLLGVSLNLLRNPLELLRSAAQKYGDIVRIPVILQSRILLNHPDYIQQVLLFQQNKFHKSRLSKEATERLLGQGLLISEGDFWRRQRRLAQPAFHRHRINDYSSAMIECAEAQASHWRDGETRNIAEEMMALTLEAAVRTLFGTTLPGEAQQVGRAMTFLMRYSLGRARKPISIPANWPTPRNKRAAREYDFLDSLVYRIISDRQAQPISNHRNDLLSMLMGAMDEDGSQMTPKQLRDETMTLFLAGHETTALTLSWTWYLLSSNPSAEKCLHEELRSVLGVRPPEVTDLPRLPYLHAIVNEVLRLYPPAYLLARTAIAPFSIGGYDFPAGETVLMSQWVMHRDPRYYDEPDDFRPERWLDGLEGRLPPGAYFPFGDGPRRCIGQGFAMLESALVIGCIAQRFRFQMVPSREATPEPLVTLRPKHGIWMTIHSR
ncbi:MAG TPA: cytochrome P450 [Candidatus Acidoferrum sp.]|nr:cytochrome P450 [Candidatus Acidoferrum sp.]